MGLRTAGILLLTLSIFSFTVSFSAILTVGGGASDYRTIKQAVFAASSGDTILIRAGTYVENIRFQKTLNLKGEGRGRVVLRPADTLIPTIWVENCPALTIEGMTIHGGAIAVSLAMSNARILENTIQAGQDGIRAVTFNHSLFFGNNILYGPFLKSKNASLSSHGVLSLGIGETVIQYNEVRGFATGLFLTGKKPCRVEKNLFSENLKACFLGGDTVIELLSNSFKNNSVDGLVLSGKVDCQMKYNVFESNMQWDIRLALSECAVDTRVAFMGTVSGEQNVFDAHYRLCPADYAWGNAFFGPKE
ncbi:MAG TPA: right-handed parallel beta-helix repeat-containing protein [Thermotogota bacterium]|nr:right-handed parallel beta-helix repeat-containing protein [Thermotogota bacterium]